ncbi:AraC-type DNA-binding protein [Oceanobacillus limi]|uniref:AraC-type DNA-binding protein n=1 Tax=Oceanobacillus limi TaxID=930131 RepID=A0A1I0AYZ0_9BACI|nr:AraC family transcriptional regulator [Oceanobacillus limi]SES99014.1 AraC-type DNA-binding protein [Oceanobacillus limi]
MKAEKIQITIKAIEYMKKNIDQEITSEELAGFVGYSAYHFNRIFKEVTGVPPRQYLTALRIEAGKQILVNSSSSILKALLHVGFRSIGSFSSKFKQLVGISPKKFQTTISELHQFVNKYDFPLESNADPNDSPYITCYLDVPSDFKGILFIGLFPRPIPDQHPIIGTALRYNETTCTFSNVPTGSYYVLAAALSKSMNPKNYFVLDNALRGKADQPIHVQENTYSSVRITLREPLPYDPPILVNLPKLLFDKDKIANKKKKSQR